MCINPRSHAHDVAHAALRDETCNALHVRGAQALVLVRHRALLPLLLPLFLLIKPTVLMVGFLVTAASGRTTQGPEPVTRAQMHRWTALAKLQAARA